uniref:Immunoglobulin V-set domain-containing protein n=1 Tax=Callorhinchus milii TaxID=7868 RepID=A0A4W3GHI5_CALMI
FARRESYLLSLTQGDSVTQKVALVNRKEGGSVTMECYYDTSLSNIADFAKKRFSAELQTSTTFTSLTISLLELSDSAVYYCALQPHSVGNQSETRTKTDSVYNHHIIIFSYYLLEGLLPWKRNINRLAISFRLNTI